MKQFTPRLDKLVRAFANKIDPRILKIYNTGAYFETIDVTNKSKIDPFCTIDESGIYLPFDNLIFEHTGSVGASMIGDEVLYIGPREYFTFATKSSESNVLNSFTMLIDDNMRMAFKVSTRYFIQDDKIALEFKGEPTVYFHHHGKWQFYDVNNTGRVEFNEYVSMFRELSNALLEYLAVINNPNYFILETKETSIIKSGKKKKKTSSSTFKVYQPREIKKKYGNTNDYVDGNGKPLEIGQERRGHWRHFKSDRFVNMKGKKKWIKSYWAGPSTFDDPSDPNKHYIVRLDL